MFNTNILDETLKTQREKLNSERICLLNKVAETLKGIQQRYGIQEAYIVGSLVIAYRWHQFSDVDVAVSGCSARVLDIMKELEEATGKVVDIIDLDSHPFPDSFSRKGVKICG